MSEHKKIPYGISNFEDLIKNNYYYVDKTHFISLLEKMNERYISFFRPRRFGKSLFISMLISYYDKVKASEFESAFKDLYVGKNPSPLRSSYYVLHLNFSGINIDNPERTLSDFTSRIRLSIENFIRKYNLNFEISAGDQSPNDLLNELLIKAAPELKGKILVLIDEYDHFTSELLGYNKSVFDEIVSKSGYFRKFFEVLKLGTETIIDRIFLTGVNPFTLDSLTSGFNISSNLTLHPRFHEMMGFNENEITDFFCHFGLNDDEFRRLLPVLKNHYDGYLFTDQASHRLYNSDMVLYFAKDYIEFRQPPRNLIDENIASSYAKIRRFILMGDQEKNLQFISDLLENREVSMVLTTKFELTQRFTLDDLKSLFFYMGLVTIQESILNVYRIRIPNYVIRELYFEFFKNLIEENSHHQVDYSDISLALTELAQQGSIDALIDLTERSLKRLSGRDFIRFDEKYIKLTMLSYLFLSRIYFVKSEYEVEEGFIDIALLPRINVKASKHALIELKYISKEKYTESLLRQKISEATAQINRYKTSAELLEIPQLLKFVVVFSGEKCVHAEQV
jgi:hypothetical protein